jgi:hypothetical protein
MCPSGRGYWEAVLCLSCRGLVFRQLCALLVGLGGRLLYAFLCEWLVVGSYVPFRYGFGRRQLCALLVGLVVGSYVPFR